MMKKRNVAVAMAAVTMASTVSPLVAQAAEVVNKEMMKSEQVKLINKVRELLAVTYDDETETGYENGQIPELAEGQKASALNSVYEIKVKKTGKIITSITELKEAIKADGDVTIVISDKGHTKDSEGKIIATNSDKYTVRELMELADERIADDEKAAAIEEYNNLKTEAQALLDTFGSGKENEQYASGAASEKTALETAAKELTGSETLNEVKDAKTALETAKKALEDKLVELKGALPFRASKSSTENLDTLVGVEGIVSVSYNDTKNILTINLENAKKIELSEGSEKLDFNSPKKDTADRVVGFNKAKAVDIKTEVLANVTLTDSKLATVEASKLFNGVMLTEEGKSIVKADGSIVTIDDVNYTVSVESEDGVQTVVKDKEFKLVLEFTLEPNTKTSENIVYKVTINSDKKSELEKLLEMVTDNQTTQMATELSGKNRVETAIYVSKELYSNPNASNGSANSIVLVEENSIVDGLTATPLAVAANAPILYTNSTSVQSSVKAEIKRALNYDNQTIADLKDTTVYLVGGENKLSANIVEEMEDLGLKVKRLAGNTRTETSLEVAKEINKIANEDSNVTVSDEAFVVGFEGESDAMSISSRAGKKDAIMPIIVADKDKLSKEAFKFVSEKFKSVDIIGGETVVTESVEEQLVEELTSSKVERVKGANRFETNAAVIEKYYKDANADTVYLAKDGQAKKHELVDSLVGGRLAAEKTAPVVLATNNLSNEQSDAIELVAGKASLVQIGGGVAKTVVEKIAKVLGL